MLTESNTNMEELANQGKENLEWEGRKEKFVEDSTTKRDVHSTKRNVTVTILPLFTSIHIVLTYASLPLDTCFTLYSIYAAFHSP